MRLISLTTISELSSHYHILGKLRNLTRIDLSYNNFSGEIPNAFTNLTKLARIDLGSNSFNAQLPISFFNLTHPIVRVDFFYNQLIGPIPSDINSHACFVYLDMSYNLLKGKVSSWMFTLSLLNHLDLSYNELDGFNDDIQVNSSQLVDVDISNNNLHGPLPMSMFELVHLRGSHSFIK